MTLIYILMLPNMGLDTFCTIINLYPNPYSEASVYNIKVMTLWYKMYPNPYSEASVYNIRVMTLILYTDASEYGLGYIFNLYPYPYSESRLLSRL